MHLYIAYTLHWMVCIAGCAFSLWFAMEPWRVYIDTPFESEFSVAWRHAGSDEAVRVVLFVSVTFSRKCGICPFFLLHFIREMNGK